MDWKPKKTLDIAAFVLAMLRLGGMGWH